LYPELLQKTKRGARIMREILQTALPCLLIAGGLFTIVCSVREYPFFVEHRKAKTMARLLGKTGMKIFYIILGLALLAAGAVFIVCGLPLETRA
jgi:small neutral amino acid transporter SnatA (MarC family)